MIDFEEFISELGFSDIMNDIFEFSDDIINFFDK